MILDSTNIISQSQNLSLNKSDQKKQKLSKTKQLILLKYLLSVVLLVVLSSSAHCESRCEISPDKQHKVVWECKNEPSDSSVYARSCRIYAVDLRGKKEWIHRESSLPEPMVEWHNNSLAEIRVPCGSPCSYSVFYDVTKGISAPFEFVLAVDADRYLMVRAGKRYLFVNSIFCKSSKAIMKIKRNFAETVALVNVIEDAHFTETGDLFIRYLSGGNYVPKEETIPIKNFYRQKFGCTPIK